MNKRILKVTAVTTALSMLLTGCGSLFMENDTTVSLSSQGTEGVDEMLAQGMEEFEVEVYEEDRWSGEITSTAKAFYIDPLANETMISFELIHHDEESHVLLYTYQALKRDPAKVEAYDEYYVYVQNNRDASDAYVSARDLYDLKSTEASTANDAFQDILSKLSLAQQTYEGYLKELEEANALYASGDLSKKELQEIEDLLTKAQQEYTSYENQKTIAGEVLAKAQKEKEDARKALETATANYEKTREQVKKAEQEYRNLVGGNTSGFSEADMDTDYHYEPEVEVQAPVVGGIGAPVAPGKLSTGTDGEEKTLLEAVMERNSSQDLLYRSEEESALTLLAETTSSTGSYIPGSNTNPILADDVGEEDQEALDALEDLEDQMKPPEDITYDSTQGVNGGDELLQDPQVMLCEVVMYDYINKRYSSVFKTEAEPNEEKMLYVNLLGDNQIAVFFKGVMMYYVQDSSTGGYKQLWKYDMSSYYEPLINEKVPNLDEWSVENVLSLSGGQENYLVIRATEKESEDIADDDDAVAEDLENRTHYLLIRLMADTLRDTSNYFLQYNDGNVYYYGFTETGESVQTLGTQSRAWWWKYLKPKGFKDMIINRSMNTGLAVDITSASNWGDDANLKNLLNQSLSTDNEDHIRAVRTAIVSSTVPLDYTGAVRARTLLGNSYTSVDSLSSMRGYMIGGKYYYLDNKRIAIVENGKNLASQNKLLGTAISVSSIANVVLDDLEQDAVIDESNTVKLLKGYSGKTIPQTKSLNMTTGVVSAEEQIPEILYFPESEEHTLERSQYLAIVDRISNMSDLEKAQLYSVYALQYYPSVNDNHSDVFGTIFSGGTLDAPDLEETLDFLEIWNDEGGTMIRKGDWADADAWRSYFGEGTEDDYSELNGAEFDFGAFDLGDNREKALENFASKLQKDGSYRFQRTYLVQVLTGWEEKTLNIGGISVFTYHVPIYDWKTTTDNSSPYYITTGMKVVNDWVDSLREALMDDSEWDTLKLWKVKSGGVFSYEAVELSPMAGTTLMSAKLLEDDYILLPMDNKSLATLDYNSLVSAGGTLLSCAENDFQGATSKTTSLFLSGIKLHTASFDSEDINKTITHEYADEREFVDGKWLEDEKSIVNLMLGKEYLRVNKWNNWFDDELPIFTQNLPFFLHTDLSMARMPIAELEVGIRCGEENAGSMAQNPGEAGSVNPSDFGATTDSQLIPNAWSLHMMDENAVWKYKENGEEKTTSAFTLLIAGQSYGLIQATSPWSSYTSDTFKDQVYAEQLLAGCYYLLLPSEDANTFYLIGYDDTTKTYKPSDIAGAGIFKVTLADLQ